MPTVLQPHPTISPPVTLGSYAVSAGRARRSLIQTSPASSSRLSHAAVGEVVKVGSGGVKRARGLIATVAAGHSLTLSDAATHAAIQSFALSHAVQPCTPPLVVLQTAGKGITRRTTYLGVAAQNGSGSEVWVWSEMIKEHDHGTIDTSPERRTAQTKESITSIHPLASGEVLLMHSCGSYSVLSASMAVDGQPSDLQIANLPSSTNGTTSSTYQRFITHSTMILDTQTSTQMFDAPFPQEDVLAAVISLTSSARSAEVFTSNAAASSTVAQEKKGRRRKTAIEVIDDAENSTGMDGLVAFGPLKVQISLVRGPTTSERFTRLGDAILTALPDAGTLLDVNVFHDGSLTLLSRSGELIFSHLSFNATSGPHLSPRRSLWLKHLSQQPLPSQPAALLRLSATHLLVVVRATGGPSSGKLVALVWDTDLEAVVVTSDWPVPSTHILEDSRTRLTVTRVGGSQGVVQLCSWAGASATEVSCATLWALPFTIPPHSVLRHAMGKAALTRAWSNQGQAKSQASSSSNATGDAGDQQQTLLRHLESISESSTVETVEKKAIEMETAFTNWLSTETARVKAAWENDRLESEAAEAELAAGSDSGSDDSDGEREREAAEEKRGSQQRRRNQREDRVPKVSLSYPFVAALLNLALPATTPKSSDPRPYAKKILKYLMDRRSISCGMLAGSEQTLIARLRSRNDWAQIMSTIRNVSDVGEKELVDLLVELLKNERRTEDESSPMEKIPLDMYLSQFVTMAVSRPLLRSMLHSHVTSADDVVALFGTVTRWLQDRAVEPLELISLADTEGVEANHAGQMLKKGQGASRRKRLGEKSSQAKAPPTTDLLQFAMDLIDVYFPLLLSTRSTHRSLDSLSKALAMHLSISTSLNTLRGPLDAFARLDSDRRKLQEENVRRLAIQRARDPRAAKQVRMSGSGGAGAGAGSVQARSQTGGGLSFEGAGKSIRLQALENSAMVGPYTVETLEV